MTQYKADHDAPSLRNKLGDTFDVHVKPNAASNQVQLLSISDDSVQISVRVTASPERGKANQAVIRLLAKELGLPKSRILRPARAVLRCRALAHSERVEHE